MSTSGTSTNPGGLKLNERLKVISNVDQKIAELMKHAQACIAELSKDKQVSKSKMEEQSTAFKNCLSSIESDLNSQMQYLSHVCVGTSHQGTTFASQQSTLLTEQSLDSLKEHLRAIYDTHLSTISDDVPME